uniref:Uncharacterized protein n=1 Tax=Rhipicephalus zambeziensis TaxID=60191 RepID=A0A224Y7K4_9ACAR
MQCRHQESGGEHFCKTKCCFCIHIYVHPISCMDQNEHKYGQSKAVFRCNHPEVSWHKGRQILCATESIIIDHTAFIHSSFTIVQLPQLPSLNNHKFECSKKLHSIPVPQFLHSSILL